MHPFFSVTLFTGQQLVLEALQRWLQRPCADEASARQRRLGLKGLITLLLRTAATGVLATVLDAAIEFRRRQLLAAAAAADAGGGSGEAAAGAGGALQRLPGLGPMLSRAGVAAWKQRLLLGIDELERRAEALGIESRRRFSPGKDPEAPASPSSSSSAAAGKPLGLARGLAAASAADLAAEEERSQRLGRTVEQLRELVRQGDAESERRLDEEVGSLVDLILGTAPPSPAGAAAASGSAAAARSFSVPARLDRLGGGPALRASRSRPALALAAAAPAAPQAAPAAQAAEQQPAAGGSQPGSPTRGGSGSGGGGGAPQTCAICMDRCVRVAVAGCSHTLCFACARRLCAIPDHAVPQCPFCRQAIDGFVALASGRLVDGSACAAAPSAEAAGHAATVAAVARA